jgi:inositol-hexakisphosphate/diphosphoinositol-pentakisphosphate 1-kinase
MFTASTKSDSAANALLGVSPQSIHSDHINLNLLRADAPASASAQSLPKAAQSSGRAVPASSGRSRSKARDPRRLSRATIATSSSPASDRPSNRDGSDVRNATYGVIGVCALDAKARSKPSRNILNRLIANKDFDVVIFGDKIILDEDVENWPVCDFLISFFSDGFPLDKAIAYEKLRHPFCVNDLLMQMVLWDRRLCLMILDSFNVRTPPRLEVSRDGGPRLSSPDLAIRLHERTGLRLPGPEDGTGGGVPPPTKVEMIEDNEVLVVDGKPLCKPFVEKPVSGEDHNIHIYYSKAMGGGGRRLFRKINNKSSERDDSLNIPRAITEPKNSYIYEQFLQVDSAEDVKAYTVGRNFCHAETRKSPVVDGVVKRNPSGKEVRYMTSLSKEEEDMASRIVQGFGQTVCGFDLLRAGGKSYVIDVNGWSFVKDNSEYYDNCASILKTMFIREKQRQEGKIDYPLGPMEAPAQVADKPAHNQSRTTSQSHRGVLKSILRSPSLSKLTHPHLTHRHEHNTADDVPLSSPLTLENKFEMLPPPATHTRISPPDSIEIPRVPDLSKTISPQRSPIPPPASKSQWKLKGMVSVVRHADRTPKQKFKFTFHTKPFVDLLKGHQEEVLFTGVAALNSVLEAVDIALEEGKEDMDKLRLLRTSLVKKGEWAGTKIQIKPMFRADRATQNQTPGSANEIESLEPKKLAHPSIMNQHRDSSQSVTMSRITAAEDNLVLDKLQLIIKWGGEPTHSARYQAQDLGENLRKDLLLMNRDCLENVDIYSSSERRVTTSAQIFATSFLNVQDFSDLPEDFIQVRKDLLDDSNAAKDEMDKVKKKLKHLLREGDSAPPEFAWPKDSPEPFLVVRRVVELMQFHRAVMENNFSKLRTKASEARAALNLAQPDLVKSTHANSSPDLTQPVANIQPRWCSGEDAYLFRERWEKLFKEFTEAEKVDPSKVSELYDSLKFDALHNRQFLEWIFLPDADLLELQEPSDIPGSDGSVQLKSSDTSAKSSSGVISDPKEDAERFVPKDWSHLAHIIGFRRHTEAEKAFGVNHLGHFSNKSGDQNVESDTSLYKGKNSSRVAYDKRLKHLRELYGFSKTLFDYIGPQEYGISPEEKLSIGLLTSLPLLKEIVEDLEEMQASEGGRSCFYFTKESHIYTLLNCILEGGIKTKISRKDIPELDYLSQINFELYESENAVIDEDEEKDRFNYSIRISVSPGCHTFNPLDV